MVQEIMNNQTISRWQQPHTFNQDKKQPGEKRTVWVIVITATMMVVEISAGILFGSMALLADGLHMASHAAALLISVFAYVYARRHAKDAKYSFGTGKVNALGGFSGAILLGVFALMMVWESVDRLIHPVSIAFNQAISVAVLGLIVNGVSVFILGDHHSGHDSTDHTHHTDHPSNDSHHDHNLRAAYFHVLADALTSITAIFALLIAKYFGLNWMDPMMGIVGAILITRWSVGLIGATSGILLDEQAEQLVEMVRTSIENQNDKICDLHLWLIAPNIYSLVLSIVSDDPKSPDEYKQRLPHDLGLEHITIEVNPVNAHND